MKAVVGAFQQREICFVPQNYDDTFTDVRSTRAASGHHRTVGLLDQFDINLEII